MPSHELGHLPVRALVLAGVLGIFACAPDQSPTGPANSANSTGAVGGYKAFFLPTLGGISGHAADLNSADQIVGQSEGTDGFFRATLWENRVPRDLGALGGSSGSGQAYAISESGRIVGEAETSTGAFHAFLWTNGVMRDLGTLRGAIYSAAQGINSAGVAVGWSETPSADPESRGPRHAVKWHRGVITDLGTIGGEMSTAFGINSFGHIVGFAEDAFLIPRAVLWKDGKKIVLPDLGGGHTEARAINDDGQIVGISGAFDGSSHAVLWENGTIRDLGVLPRDFGSWAADINGAGLVVGYSVDLGGRTRAFVWNSQLRNLGLKAPIPNMALGINEDGEIVGWSRHPDAEEQGFTGCNDTTQACRPTLWSRE